MLIVCANSDRCGSDNFPDNEERNHNTKYRNLSLLSLQSAHEIYYLSLNDRYFLIVDYFTVILKKVNCVT